MADQPVEVRKEGVATQRSIDRGVRRQTSARLALTFRVRYAARGVVWCASEEIVFHAGWSADNNASKESAQLAIEPLLSAG